MTATVLLSEEHYTSRRVQIPFLVDLHLAPGTLALTLLPIRQEPVGETLRLRLAPAMEDYMEQQETQSDPLKQKVEEVIESLRPALQMDGGDMEFVGLEEGTVLLRLTGACAGCPMSTITLKMGIEARLKQVIPEIKGVVAV